MVASLHLSVGHTILTSFIVLGLIAFRLMWGHPAIRVIVGYLPKSWQHWLFDKS
jgi:hypothetical protein